MLNYADPSAARRRLRNELRSAGDAAGWSQLKASAALDWSLSKLLRIESGSVAVAVTDLRALLTLYGVSDDALVRELVEIARASRGRPWWYEYRGIVRPQFAQYLGYESIASSFRIFGLALVPGLLQTQEYAQTVIAAHAGLGEAVAVGAQLTLRLDRADRLFQRENVKEISVLLDESTLRRQVAGPAGMRRQIRHLIDIARRPRVSFGILPFDVGAHSAMSGPFSVLQFAEAQDDVLYLDGVSGDTLIRDDQEQVAEYLARFELLRAQALMGDDAVDFAVCLAQSAHGATPAPNAIAPDGGDADTGGEGSEG
jgi:transcriptional regulator with XRE-family HTH domain